MKCVSCSHPMTPGRAHRKLPLEERRQTRAHRGRGLCSACQSRAARAGTLVDHEPRLYLRNIMLDDAIMLLEGRGTPYAQMHEPLGMTKSAFRRAVRRGVQAGDERAIRLARSNPHRKQEV